jgi:general secretion pathway protein K
MKIHQPHASRGIALIIVMIAIVSLGILAGGFAYTMKVETTLARNANRDADLEWLGRSGIELAKYVLSQPSQGGMQVDALNQKWAGGMGETNSPVADIPLDHYEIGPGVISVKIKDLDRKFNINTLTSANREIMAQALILMGVDASESSQLINAVLDWMDTDSDTQMGSSDTESSYYEGLDPPYRAKNGPFDDITELMLVKGVTPAMFFGSGQAAVQSHGSVHRDRLRRTNNEEPFYPVGLLELFTTLSSGLVNINTASATVMQLIPEVDEALAQAIITARAGPDGSEGNEDDMPFRSIQELSRVPGMPPVVVNQFARYFTTRSTTFEVHVTASISNFRREYTAVLRRDGNRVVTLFTYWR